MKRLIGLPGDEISIIDGFVFVNGLLIEGSEVGIEKLNSGSATNSISTKIVYTEGLGRHSYSAQRIPSRIRSEQLRFKVPADHFFFMGDNRDNSSDSRAWGFAPRKNLKGQAIGVLWSVRWEALLPRFDLGRVGVLLN